MLHRESDHLPGPRLWLTALVLVLLAIPGLGQEPPPAPEPPPEAGETVESPEAEAPSPEEIDERVEELRRELEEQAEEARVRAEREAERIEREVEREAERIAEEVRRRSDNRVSFGNTVWVRKGEVASEVVAIGSSVEVDGEVLGDVTAVAGSARVNGRVTGSVTAVGGGVELGPDAEVLGDVNSIGGRIDRDEDATVLGEVSEVSVGPDFEFDFGDFSGGWDLRRERPSFFSWGAFWDLSWKVVSLAFVVLLACLLLFLFPKPVEQVRHVVVTEPIKAGLIGVATPFLMGPAMLVLTLVLVISIVGILLLPLLWSAVILAILPLTLFGYTAAALAVGDLVRTRFDLKIASRYLTLLVGVGVLQVAWFLANLFEILVPLRPIGWLFGLISVVVLFVALAIGIGAALVALFGRRRRADQPTWSPPPPPPPAPAPTEFESAGELAAETEVEEAEPEGESQSEEPTGEEGDGEAGERIEDDESPRDR